MDNIINAGDATTPEEPILQQEDDEESVVTGCADTFYDPRRGGHRFIALILMCIIGFGKIFFCSGFFKIIVIFSTLPCRAYIT